MKNTDRCSATNVDGRKCKRVGFVWKQAGGQILCAPHAYRVIFPSRDMIDRAAAIAARAAVRLGGAR